jgi:hypothetical protein
MPRTPVPWRFSDASWEREDGFVMQASEKPALPSGEPARFIAGDARLR